LPNNNIYLLPNKRLHLFCNRRDTAREDQGMICNSAYPVMFSKVLNDLNTAKLLTEMQVLSD